MPDQLFCLYFNYPEFVKVEKMFNDLSGKNKKTFKQIFLRIFQANEKSELKSKLIFVRH